MPFVAIISRIRVQDVVDILFLTIVAYHLYLWFRGTKAFKALVGLAALGLIFTVSQLWGLFLTTWMFQILWQVLIILLIILFQSEIRQVLERMNPFRSMGWRKGVPVEDWIKRFSEACFSLSKRKIGALIILERSDNCEEWITGGILLEGEPGGELLLSIFQKDSPLHDGAVIVRDGRVVKVGAYLPLSSAEGLPRAWGTRHRAALGISERCDCWVVVVSEERSEVSLARGGQMIPVENAGVLANLAMEALKPPALVHLSLWGKIRTPVVTRWQAKLGSLALVSVLWLLFAGQQDFEVRLEVPLEIRNLPNKMEIVQPLNPPVQVTIRGLRKDASTVNPAQVTAWVDLTLAGFGRRNFRITPEQIVLPSEQVNVVRIEPAEIVFEFRTREQTPSF